MTNSLLIDKIFTQKHEDGSGSQTCNWFSLQGGAKWVEMVQTTFRMTAVLEQVSAFIDDFQGLKGLSESDRPC